MNRATRVACCALASLAMCERFHPAAREHAARVVDAAYVRDVAVVEVPPSARPDPLQARPVAVLTDIGAGVIVDSTDRVRGGGDQWLGDGTSGIGPRETGARLFPGDRLATRSTGARIRLASGADVDVRPDAHVMVPPCGGSDLIVAGGIVSVEPHGLQVRVDAPGGRLRGADGAIWVAVTDDGTTLFGTASTAVVNPSPPAPASTLGARIERARHGRHGHPISLDVQVGEVAEVARPLASVPLGPSRPSVEFGPDGRPRSVQQVTLTSETLTRWRADRDRGVHEPGQHVLAIGHLARAGAGDLADARVLAAELRRRPREGAAPILDDADDRSETELRLAAAIARARARAERARTLAIRGDDVTSLVALAGLEATEAVVRGVLFDVRPTTLDSGEHRRVP